MLEMQGSVSEPNGTDKAMAGDLQEAAAWGLHLLHSRIQMQVTSLRPLAFTDTVRSASRSSSCSW